MMGTVYRTLAYGTALALAAATVMAHVRLCNPSNGAPLYWSSPGNIGIVVTGISSSSPRGVAHRNGAKGRRPSRARP